MGEEGSDFEEAKLQLIQLLQADRFEITETAAVTGRRWMGMFFDYPTQYNLINHILDLLEEAPNPLRLVKMGNPPGSRGIAYRIVDPSHRDLYIKVKIEDDTAWVLSFKLSDHAKG